jgi:hypothetical protein
MDVTTPLPVLRRDSAVPCGIAFPAPPERAR